jgi:hypothetical protein
MTKRCLALLWRRLLEEAVPSNDVRDRGSRELQFLRELPNGLHRLARGFQLNHLRTPRQNDANLRISDPTGSPDSASHT